MKNKLEKIIGTTIVGICIVGTLPIIGVGDIVSRTTEYKFNYFNKPCEIVKIKRYGLPSTYNIHIPRGDFTGKILTDDNKMINCNNWSYKIK